MITSPDPPRAGTREWVGLALLLLPAMMLTAAVGVQLLALPAIAADLQTSPAELLWITDSYNFAMAGLLVTMGALGDRVGRRRVLLIGAALFAAASVLAAFAGVVELLIVARALTGVAGALMMPATLALISTMFADPRQRATAIALWVTAMSVGIGIGPLAGGAVLESLWWGAAFLVPVPVMLLVLAAGPLLLPEHRGGGAQRMDLLSVLQFMGAILPVVYGVKRFAEVGPEPQVAVAIAVGAFVGAVFLRRQARIPDPLVDLELFRDRAFSAALLMLLLGLMAMYGVQYLVPQFLQVVAGLSPLDAGLLLVPVAVAHIIGAQLTPPLARRMRPAFVIALGMAVAAVGFALIGMADGPTAAVLGLAILFFGLAPILVLGTDLVVGSAPADKAGSASALSSTTLDLGISLGVALVGSAAAAVYRLRITDTVPGGTPPWAADAAREGIGGALAAAERLPDGARLLDPAREAFTAGMNAAGGIGIALCLLVLGLALTMVRHIRPTGETVEEPTPAAADAQH